MVDPRDCWCRIFISGRARSGSRACDWSTTMNQGSGSRTDTTIAAIPGSSSVTKVTDDDARSPKPGRWQQARVIDIWNETSTAKTFRLQLGERSSHLAGQHYIVRLAAPDGYSASRSYSVASAPDGSARIDLTVERLPRRRGLELPSRRRRAR